MSAAKITQQNTSDNFKIPKGQDGKATGTFGIQLKVMEEPDEESKANAVNGDLVGSTKDIVRFLK